MMRRVFAVDVLACARCGGRVRLIATLGASDVTRRILAISASRSRCPTCGPPRPARCRRLGQLTRSLTACPIRGPRMGAQGRGVRAGKTRVLLREAHPTMIRSSDRPAVQGRASLRRAKGGEPAGRQGRITRVPSISPLMSTILREHRPGRPLCR